MKILLVGEFSGVHNNLKKGLESLGHTVRLVSDGDIFKKFESDLKIAPYKSKFIGKILNILYFFINIEKYIGYDVVQFISPFSFPYYYYYLGLPNIIFFLNNKKIYYACGDDPAYLSASSEFSYFPHDDTTSSEYPNYNRRNKMKIYSWFIRKIDYIIPAMYEYYKGYSNSSKLLNPIMLPGSGNYSKTNIERINILFGITRRNFKGCDYILKALDEIRSKFSSKVNIQIVENIPFNKYLKILSQADILIDQCKSYSYGMNAIFAMEMGIIVLSGSEKVAMDYLSIENTAVINIIPSSAQIKKVLSTLIESSVLDNYKQMSLEQAKKYHDPVKIAKSFIKAYI